MHLQRNSEKKLFFCVLFQLFFVVVILFRLKSNKLRSFTFSFRILKYFSLLYQNGRVSHSATVFVNSAFFSTRGIPTKINEKQDYSRKYMRNTQVFSRNSYFLKHKGSVIFSTFICASKYFPYYSFLSLKSFRTPFSFSSSLMCTLPLVSSLYLSSEDSFFSVPPQPGGGSDVAAPHPYSFISPPFFSNFSALSYMTESSFPSASIVSPLNASEESFLSLKSFIENKVGNQTINSALHYHNNLKNTKKKIKKISAKDANYIYHFKKIELFQKNAKNLYNNLISSVAPYLLSLVSASPTTISSFAVQNHSKTPSNHSYFSSDAYEEKHFPFSSSSLSSFLSATSFPFSQINNTNYNFTENEITNFGNKSTHFNYKKDHSFYSRKNLSSNHAESHDRDKICLSLLFPLINDSKIEESLNFFNLSLKMCTLDLRSGDILINLQKEVLDKNISPSDWQIVFLGTGSMQPSKTRKTSSMALRRGEDKKDLWLFDAGEATQLAAIDANVRPSSISKIFISHLHGDHCLGIPALLALISSSEDPLCTPRTIDIYGPHGIRSFLRTALTAIQIRKCANFRAHELMKVTTFNAKKLNNQIPFISHVPPVFRETYLEERDIYPNEDDVYTLIDDDETKVIAVPIKHSVPTVAYIVEEKVKKGGMNGEYIRPIVQRNFDLLKNLPELNGNPYAVYSEHLSKLNQGESFTFPDETEVSYEKLMKDFPLRRKIVFCQDTCDAQSILPYALDADVLIHEATCSEETGAPLEEEMRYIKYNITDFDYSNNHGFNNFEDINLCSNHGVNNTFYTHLSKSKSLMNPANFKNNTDGAANFQASKEINRNKFEQAFDYLAACKADKSYEGELKNVLNHTGNWNNLNDINNKISTAFCKETTAEIIDELYKDEFDHAFTTISKNKSTINTTSNVQNSFMRNLSSKTNDANKSFINYLKYINKAMKNSIVYSHSHSTPTAAGLLASSIKAKRLVLTHFSQRYKGDNSLLSILTMRKIEDEARKAFYSDCQLDDKSSCEKVKAKPEQDKSSNLKVIAAWDGMILNIPKRYLKEA